MSAATAAFTTTELSRSSRKIIRYAREHPRSGAIIRDGADGTLFRLSIAGELDQQETFRRFLDTLIPLAIQGVERTSASDFPGAGWLVHLPIEARRDFVKGALELLLQVVDGMGFDDLDRWFNEWREEAMLFRAGIIGGQPARELVAPDDRPRRRK
ncbi:MAG: hypothetical protein WD576_01870 [Nitriliruptoraceae bacterium]